MKTECVFAANFAIITNCRLHFWLIRNSIKLEGVILRENIFKKKREQNQNNSHCKTHEPSETQTLTAPKIRISKLMVLKFIFILFIFDFNLPVLIIIINDHVGCFFRHHDNRGICVPSYYQRHGASVNNS